MTTLRFIFMLSFVLARCASKTEVVTPRPSNKAEEVTERSSIGGAIMLPDGTIEMMLRAELPGGGIGDGFLRIGPQDPRYEMIRQHIGLQEPGVGMPVPPFPSKAKN